MEKSVLPIHSFSHWIYVSLFDQFDYASGHPQGLEGEASYWQYSSINSDRYQCGVSILELNREFPILFRNIRKSKYIQFHYTLWAIIVNGIYLVDWVGGHLREGHHLCSVAAGASPQNNLEVPKRLDPKVNVPILHFFRGEKINKACKPSRMSQRIFKRESNNLN